MASWLERHLDVADDALVVGLVAAGTAALLSFVKNYRVVRRRPRKRRRVTDT